MNKKIRLIYILGNSYNGSSILSYLIGSSPKVNFIGETKHFNRIQREKETECTCGKNQFDCEYRKPLYEKNYKNIGRPGIYFKLIIFFQILIGINFSKNKKKKSDLTKLFQNTQKIYNNYDGYILDSSKSAWRLSQLVQQQDLDIKVVYIQRDFKNNVASFVGHGINFFKSIMIYKSNHFTIDRFLKTSHIEHLKIEYKDFCENTSKTAEDLGKYLDLDYKNYLDMLKTKEFHVLTGNSGTRSQLIKGFENIKYDDKWKKVLKNRQQKIVKILD